MSKWAIRSNFFDKKSKIIFLVRFLYIKNERFAHSLFFNERCEQISQVPHQKWAMWANRSGCSSIMSDVSESLRSLIKNERPWAIRSGRSQKMSDHEPIAPGAHQEWANERIARIWANRSFAPFFAKNKRFTQKTDERIPSPGKMALKTLSEKYPI